MVLPNFTWYQGLGVNGQSGAPNGGRAGQVGFGEPILGLQRNGALPFPGSCARGRYTVSDGDAVWKELARRYPLLQEIIAGTQHDECWDQLPRFLGFLLAAAESPGPQTCCILLPETESIGYLAAVLLALSKLRDEFPDLLRDYARKGLEVGQRVRVLPDNCVYQYGGVLPGHGDFFKLEVLDARDKAWKTFPVKEILRLEPTERSRPKGHGVTDLGQFELSTLDHLVGMQTGGNTSLFRNHVMFLTARLDFEQLSSAVVFGRRDRTRPEAEVVTGETIPWGYISSDGRIERDDRYQRAGEPLVAVTHSPDYLALACEACPPFTKFVIINEADKLAGNLQAYDRIAGTQRLLIVASHRSAESVGALAERGCLVWRLTPAELLLGESLPSRRRSRGFTGRIYRAVDNWRNLELLEAPCTDACLEAVATKLEEAAEALNPDAPDEEVRRFIGRLFSLLCRASEVCESLAGDDRVEMGTQLETLHRDLGQREMWLSRAAVVALRQACAALAPVLTVDAPPGWGKGPALLELLSRLGAEGAQRIMVVTRTQTGARSAQAWLRGHGVSVPVTSLAGIDDGEEFDAIVLTSWPNRRQFEHLVGLYLAPRVCIVGYGFELNWLRMFKRRSKQHLANNSLAPAERAGLTGLPEELLSTLGEKPPDIGSDDPDDGRRATGLLRIDDMLSRRRKGEASQPGPREESKPAKYVGFVGASYAWLTEWQHVPVVTALVRGDGGQRPGVSMRTVDELKAGDDAVFREGAESNILRAQAEELVGTDKYGELRDVADAWRRTLWRLGENVKLQLADHGKIHRTLRRWGLTVGLQTVRKWLFDESQIGPGDVGAIDAIAKATDDEDLSTRKNEIWDAIRTIRALHVEAGFRLTNLLFEEMRRKPPQLAARETRIDFGGGQAWIVEVEEIGESFEERPVSQVNRLLWDETFA